MWLRDSIVPRPIPSFSMLYVCNIENWGEAGDKAIPEMGILKTVLLNEEVEVYNIIA